MMTFSYGDTGDDIKGLELRNNNAFRKDPESIYSENKKTTRLKSD